MFRLPYCGLQKQKTGGAIAARPFAYPMAKKIPAATRMTNNTQAMARSTVVLVSVLREGLGLGWGYWYCCCCAGLTKGLAAGPEGGWKTVSV